MNKCLLVLMCTTCIQYPQRPEEGTRSSGTRVIEGYKPGCAYWGQSLGPLQEQMDS